MAEKSAACLGRPPGSLPLRRIHLFWIALAYGALAVYGSLVPLHFTAMPLQQALERFEQVPYLELAIHSRSDWVANILLMIPLSFLMMATLCADRRRRADILAAAVVIPACALLAATIEFTQVFFPQRTVSLNDIVAESLGALIGTALWLVCGRAIIDWCRRLWTANRAAGAAGLLLPGYLVVLVLIHVMPLDLTISPVEVYHKWQEGRVQLLPFHAGHSSPFEAVQKNLWNIGYFLPLGVLLGLAPRREEPTRRRAFQVLGIALAVAAGVEMLQLFVYTRYFDTTDICTGTLGVLLGWTAVIWLRPAFVSSAETNQLPRRGRRGRVTAPSRLLLLGLVLLAWLGVLIVSYWYPFNFVFSRELLADQFQRIGWLPFADYYRATEYHAFDQFLRRTLLFFPLGALCTMIVPRAWGKRTATVLAFSSVLVMAVLLETGQLMLPGRYPGLTDVLIELFGGWLGCAFVSWARSLEPFTGQLQATWHEKRHLSQQDPQ